MRIVLSAPWLFFAAHLIIVFLLILPLVDSARYRGQWITSHDRIKVVAKFGFQQTNPNDRRSSRGFVFGNITSTTTEFANSSQPFLFAIVPEAQYSSFVQKSTNEYLAPCARILQNISALAYESRCFKNGKGDLFRWVPCPKGSLCGDEDDPTIVISGSQLTIQIEEPITPEYWYVLLIACNLDDACAWQPSPVEGHLAYDIWLTNGHPIDAYSAALTLQFSFDEQETAEIYLITLIVYVLFLGIAYRAKTVYKHRMPQRMRVLSFIIMCKTVGVGLQTMNVLVYSADGEGVFLFRFLGDIMRVTAVDTMCILLILIARGWGTTRGAHAVSRTVMTFWAALTLFDYILLLCNILFVMDFSDQVDIFHTWPGYGMLFVRSLFAMWFLVEVRHRISSEQNDEKVNFFAHLGAGFLVWFVYIFGLGVVATFISDLWRFRFILGIRTLANVSAVAILLHIFWPTSTNRKFFDGDTSVYFKMDKETEYIQ